MKGAAKASDQRIDWHYVGGRGRILMLDGDVEKAIKALHDALREEERHCFHDLGRSE